MPMFTPKTNNFLDQELWNRYQDNLSQNRPHWRYLLVAVSPDNSKADLIHAEPCGRPVQESLEDLYSRLPDQEVCWIVFNLPYLVSGGGKRNKNLFISWIPDTLHRPRQKEVVEIKMSSVLQGGRIKSSFNDVTHSLRAESPDELSLRNMIDVASRFERETVDIPSSLVL